MRNSPSDEKPAMATSTKTRPPPPPPDAAAFLELAKARMKDAEVLLANNRNDGAAYLCGYAVEFTLKARICTLLGWTTYQISRGYESFKTHDLPILLSLSGCEQKNVVGSPFASEWSTVLICGRAR
jgi:hypothetical protein